MTKTLRVAAVQMDCKAGDVPSNLKKAQRHIEDAASLGAKLVLLPELMPSGYMATEEIWEYAQTIDGLIVEWAMDLAQRLGVYIGFSFLEAEGEEFFNAFILVSPEAKLCGRVRKNPPASIEAYFYRGWTDSHIIETDIGRIGIGICYENLLYSQICELYEGNVDLVLSPAAAGRPKVFLPGDVNRFEKMLVGARSIYAKMLAVPVIVANRVGLLETELPGGLPYLESSFPGLSSIVDGDGIIKAELGEEEGVIVSDITISDKKYRHKPKRYGSMWAVPVPWYAFLWPLTQKMGEKSYIRNTKRKQKASSKSNVYPAK